jgi:ribosomal protein L44E
LKTARGLRIHTSKVHGDAESIRSALSTESLSNLDRVTHEGDDPSSSGITMTIAAATTDDCLSFSCRSCEKSFRTARGLRTHASKVHGDEESIRSALSTESLPDLERTIHEADKGSRSTENISISDVQASTSTDVASTPDFTMMSPPETTDDVCLSFCCEICGKSLKTARGLRNHASKVHGDAESIRSALSTESLSNLDRVTHEADDASRSGITMTSAAATTDDCLSFSCRSCEKSFRTARGLRTHASKVHGDEESIRSALSTESLPDLERTIHEADKGSRSTETISISDVQASTSTDVASTPDFTMMSPPETTDDVCLSFCCRICGKSLKTARGLRNHASKVHGDAESIRSALSTESLSNLDRFMHEADDASRSGITMTSAAATTDDCLSFSCRSCEKSFRTARGLRTHASKVHGDEESIRSALSTESLPDLERTIHEADKGSRSTETISISDVQASTSTDVASTPDFTMMSPPETTDDVCLSFCCRICGKSLKTARGLRTHASKVHGDAESVRSALSTESLSNLDRVTRGGDDVARPGITMTSAAAVTDDVSLSFPCRICARSFKTARGLRAHVLRTHGNNDSLQPGTSTEGVLDLAKTTSREYSISDDQMRASRIAETVIAVDTGEHEGTTRKCRTTRNRAEQLAELRQHYPLSTAKWSSDRPTA